ncbi:MAG: hypothetical protein A2271_04730 [Candidatus Moranbacteria bacterium RIFOXYA12_FULL_35_19]|nr:MAG: hypothetical protein UR78_C0001G0073 [Candidatus Moranbacteria bacterium GW2011_GWF2_35_39]OGI30945.1 MAG: hypothetical protein A2343_03990 [Candidatus Moranbacteria bacterium RIFOXYB12_FULL_35_8]OGI35744.1 MAG: hypothetical protein A2271_04730 [Candidatus Moranbacteria bacterium RIFOXYA12_FULL_35_19]
MKKYFIKNLAVIFLGAIFLIVPANFALADDEIDVEFSDGTDIDGDEIFDEDNIYPGWEKSKTIRVQNEHPSEDADLYFTFDVNGDKKLAEKLKLYVIKVANDDYRIGGEGDRWTLEEADEEELYVDRLDSGEEEEYEIKIKFDKDAGNEYQGLETDFDIDFQIESGEAGSGTEGEILAGEGRVVSGNPPAEEVQGATTEEGGQGGGEIAGQEEKCQSWPKWVWILALAIFAGIFGYDARKNYVREEYGWKIALLWTALAVGFWYYFDKCREFQWFLYGAIIIAIAGHFLYLYLLRKKVKTPKLD